MNPRIAWPVAALVGLGLLILGLSSTSAQRGGGGGGDMQPFRGGPGPMMGRFVVAYASADRVVIVDSMTGHVYKATERDFRPISSLPNVEGGRQPMMPREMDEKEWKKADEPQRKRFFPKEDKKPDRKEFEKDKDGR